MNNSLPIISSPDSSESDAWPSRNVVGARNKMKRKGRVLPTLAIFPVTHRVELRSMLLPMEWLITNVQSQGIQTLSVGIFEGAGKSNTLTAYKCFSINLVT
jgi:hypothetical protein